ncbi:MAG: hypothetical protein AB1610_01130 [Nitrospirota bacterium]
MELTKAQKAAIEDIKVKIREKWPLGTVLDIIKNYGLEKRVDVLESVYEVLMEENRFDDAASFAKTYGV